MLMHIDRDNEHTVEEIVFHMPPDALNENTDDHGESDLDIRSVSTEQSALSKATSLFSSSYNLMNQIQRF